MSYDLTLARNVLVNRAAYASVFVAITLIAAKFWAWWVTGSVSLQATFIDSLLDALTSLANLFAVRMAMRPPDKFHRFGYGKSEAISALGQAFVIFTSGLWLFYETLGKAMNPVAPKETMAGVFVMLLSVLLTGLLLVFQRHVIARTKSMAIRADAAHYRMDLVINVGVIFSLLAAQYEPLVWVDAFTGFVIGLYIVKSCISVGREAINILIDKELDSSVRRKIIQIINQAADVRGYHDLRTRNSGNRFFIQCHLELNGTISLLSAHKISVDVRTKLREAFPDADVLLHLDPEDDRDYDHG
ncbi:MAG: cation transporter [Alphaproteobacteria bacterium]|nr:MAG: cation transporter [Alphaproteobacteria bacterium]